MELTRGQVVKSKAGRDKGRFLAIVDLAPPWALVCDGKQRPLERPKRKKLLHLAPTATVLPEEALATNRTLRAALGAFPGERKA
ncbi:KOW domain-containing RNA-binding protein [Acutalibacter caecimuris]|uniref:KOW domain-containing RNA-binding protein n=1 Tax=Acutalibacter caecimuris TaxID=3093657 RepID=UPI002AC954B6|nr:KOW domain-containing RNA-binding protein [Acutalibacter sp. M00118]